MYALKTFHKFGCFYCDKGYTTRQDASFPKAVAFYEGPLIQ